MNKTHHLRSLTDSSVAHLAFLVQTPTFTFFDSDLLKCLAHLAEYLHMSVV